MELFFEIRDALLNKQELVVATIIGDSGSTPRSAGSKMAVYRDGRIAGTIGGGCVEGDVICRALKLFEEKTAVISSYNLTQSGKVDDMDLVCGGQMQILLEHVACNASNSKMYEFMCDEIVRSRSFSWLGKISDGKDGHIERAVLTEDNEWIGDFEEETVLTDKLSDTQGAKKPAHTLLFAIDKQRYVVERIHPPDAVYLMGAGHVSKEVSILAKQVGFTIFVFDDRAEFAAPERFPDASGVYVREEFENVFGEHQIVPGSSIVIVTRGHRFDKEVLAQALRTKASYIGMIGSRKKREHVYQALLAEGFSKAQLEAVHCPIGLPIAAETPAEIGVSIVAQLIEHRAQRNQQA